MSFAFLLHVFQILASVLLVALILLQVRTQGLGGMFGQSASVFRVRRGLEKTLFQGTIALAILFVLLSILSARFTSPL